MITLFSNLPKVRTLQFRKRELILRAQDSLHSTYCVKSGYVRNYVITPSGEELTLAILKKGDIFPLEVFIGNDTNSYFFEAMTSAAVYKGESESVKLLIQNSPAEAQMLNHEIITRFYGLLERIQFFAFGSASGRVASIIAICAERFGEEKQKGEIVIKVSLTHRDIASLVGLTRETVSIEMKKIEKKGYISYTKRSKITVKRLQKLRTVV